jgi:hypothetical protein
MTIREKQNEQNTLYTFSTHVLAFEFDFVAMDQSYACKTIETLFWEKNI